MSKFLKDNWFWVIIVLLVIAIPIVINSYKYDRCVKINNEELEKCQKGEFGDYDCSVFENAEELCNEI